MRYDLDKIIFDTGRTPGDSWKSYRYSHKDKNDIENGNYWSETQETTRRYDKSIASRLTPLRRYLESRVGFSWNDTWSEICQLFDNRTICGYRLRDHVLWLVDNNNIKKEMPRFYRYFGHYNQLYVDDYGILREHKATPRKKRYKKQENKFIKQVGNLTYFLTDHGWFVTANLVYNNWLAIFSTEYKPLFANKNTVPRRDKYFVQMSLDKPFHIITDRRKLVKSKYIAFDYKQCDKNEIRSNIHGS
jgi:hypothetical protein